VARARRPDPAHPRRTRHRIGGVQPPRQGILTGTITADTHFGDGDARASGTAFPRFSEQNRRANEAPVAVIRQYATQHDATPAQVALAWLLAQRPSIVPIPGTTKLHRIEENLGATTIVLPADDLTRLDEAASAIRIVGDRYSPQIQQMINR
jgi:aryl-alcohol dehydrogenase-like predicted oxidoreductase